MSSLKKIKLFENDLLIYDGEVDKYNNRNGYGISYINGIKEYEGYWKNNLFHGDGSYYQNGVLLISSYKDKELIGRWEEGVFNGLGLEEDIKKEKKRKNSIDELKIFYNHDGIGFN